MLKQAVDITPRAGTANPRVNDNMFTFTHIGTVTIIRAMDTFKKYLYWTALALFIYMPFHIFLSQWLSTYTNGLDAWKIGKDVVTALLVAALVGTVLLTRKYTKPYLVLLGFAAVYFLLHIVLWFGTNQPNDTGLLATVYNNRLIWYVLIGYSLAILAPKLAKPRRLVEIFLIISTVVAVLGIVQRFLPADFLTNFGYSIERGAKPSFAIDDKPDLPRIFSTIRDPNSLGAFLILPCTILGMALVRRWRTSERMLLAGLLMLHVLALLLTFSRSALIGAILAGIAGLAFIFRQSIRAHLHKFVWLSVALFIMLGGIVFILRDQYVVQNVVFHADESTTLDDPQELRVDFLQKGLNGVADNPEGNGPGTAGLVSTRLPQGGLLTENYYLQIAYEVGIAGLLLFLAFLSFVLIQLWTLRQNRIVQALLASFAGLTFINLLFHGWSNEAVAIAWFMLAGVALGSPVKTLQRLSK